MFFNVGHTRAKRRAELIQILLKVLFHVSCQSFGNLFDTIVDAIKAQSAHPCTNSFFTDPYEEAI